MHSIDGDSDVMNEASTSNEDSPKQKRTQRNRKINHQNFAKQRSTRNNQGGRMMNYQSQVQPMNTFEKFEQQRYRALEPPLRQHTKLNLTESQLVQYLKNYLLDETLMRLLGFPIEYDVAPSLAIIYKYPPYEFFSQQKQTTRSLNTTYYNNDPIIVNANDGLTAAKDNFKLETNDSDSGQGSGSSSPSEDFEISPVISSGSSPSLSASVVSSQKECSRCGKGFFVTNCGQYVTTEPCLYHWGKASRFYDGQMMRNVYSCCNREFDGSSENGCTANRVHVWTGVAVGMNGPYEGFVRTKQRPTSVHSNGGPQIFALDCEMCFTACGLELAKVSIIRSDGNLFYESFVRPERDVVDYNTRFSGITEKDLNMSDHNNSRRASTVSNSSTGSTGSNKSSRSVRTLKEVQKDLLKFIFDDTILIGHSIENDLKALKLIHKTIIDTSISFPHYYGLPYRRSLKSLTKTILKRDIQQSETGHCSFEDSRATLELMLWKVRKDFRTMLETNVF